MCGVEWNSRDAFLADPCIYLNGYQANFVDLEAGLFFFTHKASSCGTTLAILADKFTDLHDGPVFGKSLRGTQDCPKLCTRTQALEACPQQCECAFVRDVLQKVLNWPKNTECEAAMRRSGKA